MKRQGLKVRILEIMIIFFSILFLITLGMAITPNVIKDVSLLDDINNSLNSFNPFNTNKVGPSDFIREEQIEVYSDRIIIRISGASLSRYAPTGSMGPVLDENANGIEIPVTSKEQIQVGDIIAFHQQDSNELIVHRVIEIGYDNQGWYCITKGDNNSVNDGKIRFPQIEYKTVIIIY